MTKNIKIFVSHRIDQLSQKIESNPLFVNVRCGAVFDKRPHEVIGKLLGDDSGDNISAKRNEFNELTVQYWAWKNQKADYFGLCHYRRYLSFTPPSRQSAPETQLSQICEVGSRDSQVNREHINGCVEVPFLSEEVVERHGLNESQMRAQIEKYDLICMEPISLKTFGLKTNYEAMQKAPAWHRIKDVDKTIEIINRLYPEMADATNYYFFKSDRQWLYNCWVMSRELFEKFSEFQFKVLFELEGFIDYETYSAQQRRACGTIGERLFGVFVTYIESLNKYKIGFKPLLFIKNPEKVESIKPIDKEAVTIVTLSSNFYVPYLYVFLHSLQKNSNNKNKYDLIVLEKNITKENKAKLRSLFHGKENFTLRFYNPALMLAGCQLHVADSRYSEEAYYRMLVPWILADYKKAVVMDCDIVLNDDIALLFKETNLSSFLVAGAMDVVFQGFLNGTVPDAMVYCQEQMKMKNPYDYVNTGVLVFNLDEWRKAYTKTDIIRLMGTKKFRIQEQDLLNILFEGRIKFFEIGWNYYVPVNNFIKESLEAAPKLALDEYKEIRKPHLYHYASSPKPWDSPETVELSEIWWSYARETIFYETILFRKIEGNFNYLLTHFNKFQKNSGKTKKVLKKILNSTSPIGTKRREVLLTIYRKTLKRWL